MSNEVTIHPSWDTLRNKPTDLVTDAALLAALADYVTDTELDTELETVPRIIFAPNPDPIEPNRNFNFYRGWINLTGTQGDYQNIVESWGYNFDKSNPSEPSAVISIEAQYQANNVGPFVNEWHFQGVTIEGDFHRDFSVVSPTNSADKNDPAASIAAFATNKIDMLDYDRDPKWQADWLNDRIFVQDQIIHVFNGNNYPLFRMYNGAKSGYLDLPYFNSANQYLIPYTVRMHGAHSTGLGQNAAFYIQGTGTFPNNSCIVQVVGPAAVTGNIAAVYSAGQSTGDYSVAIYNENNTAATNKAVFEGAFLRTTGKGLSRYYCAANSRGFEFGFDGDQDKFFIASVFGSTNSANFYFDITRASPIVDSLATFRGSLAVVKNLSNNGDFTCTPGANNSFKVRNGLAVVTPAASISSASQACAIFSGTTGSGFAYSNSGTFLLLSETKANIDGGSAGAGTIDFQISGTTATMFRNFKANAQIGFNGTNPIAKPTVTGSRGGNAALESLLTALANYGLITNSTS